MTNWTEDQITDLRDYVALGYKLDEILAETGRPRGEVEAKLVEFGIWAPARDPRSSSNRDLGADDEASPEAGPQAEASLAGTGTGTLAGHEGRIAGEAVSAVLPTISEVTKSSGEGQATAASIESPTTAMALAEAPSDADDAGGVHDRCASTSPPNPNLAAASAPAGRAEEDSRCLLPSSSVALSVSDGKQWRDLTKEERIYQVRKLADGSASFTEIGRMLGTSRGAICGFVDRNRSELGIDKLGQGKKGGRPRAASTQAHLARQDVPAARAPSMVTPMPAPKTIKPVSEPIVPPDPSAVISLAEAGMHRCHFPLWAHGARSPSMDDGKACGMPTRPGAPYCPHHCAIAYRIDPPRATRKDKEAA